MTIAATAVRNKGLRTAYALVPQTRSTTKSDEAGPERDDTEILAADVSEPFAPALSETGSPAHERRVASQPGSAHDFVAPGTGRPCWFRVPPTRRRPGPLDTGTGNSRPRDHG